MIEGERIMGIFPLKRLLQKSKFHREQILGLYKKDNRDLLFYFTWFFLIIPKCEVNQTGPISLESDKTIYFGRLEKKIFNLHY